MSVAKITEIQSSSTTSFDDAIKAGISRADKTLRNLTGAWVKSEGGDREGADHGVSSALEGLVHSPDK